MGIKIGDIEFNSAIEIIAAMLSLEAGKRGEIFRLPRSTYNGTQIKGMRKRFPGKTDATIAALVVCEKITGGTTEQHLKQFDFMYMTDSKAVYTLVLNEISGERRLQRSRKSPRNGFPDRYDANSLATKLSGTAWEGKVTFDNQPDHYQISGAIAFVLSKLPDVKAENAIRNTWIKAFTGLPYVRRAYYHREIWDVLCSRMTNRAIAQVLLDAMPAIARSA